MPQFRAWTWTCCLGTQGGGMTPPSDAPPVRTLRATNALRGRFPLMAALRFEDRFEGDATTGRRAKPYAAERWARAVIDIIDVPIDPKTLEAWGKIVGASRGTLRAWCKAAHLGAKSSLDFARLLRAVMQSRGQPSWDLQNLLDIVDERTVRHLLDRAGVPDVHPDGTPLDLDAFLARQRLVPK